MTLTLTCVLDVACDCHLNLKILAGCVLHVQDIVDMKDLAQQGAWREQGTFGATDLSLGPHLKAKEFKGLGPFPSPFLTSP